MQVESILRWRRQTCAVEEWTAIMASLSIKHCKNQCGLSFDGLCNREIFTAANHVNGHCCSFFLFSSTWVAEGVAATENIHAQQYGC